MLIGKKVLLDKQIELIIKLIKKKKELNDLNDQFVYDELEKYFRQEQKIFFSLSEGFTEKSKDLKIVIKKVRAKLRRAYSLFRVEQESKKRKELVEEYLVTKKKGLIEEILKTHSSTKERLMIYPQLYKKIFKITGKPKRIIDLGCGINPFSVGFMKLNQLTYHAYDISNEEVELLNLFFKTLNSVAGKADVLDTLQWTKLKRLREVDIAFLFKMTDVLDRGQGHKTSEKVIKLIPAKYIVVSFPTLTMSGRKMNHPRRRWIELMSKRLGYNVKMLEFSNELFYVLEK